MKSPHAARYAVAAALFAALVPSLACAQLGRLKKAAADAAKEAAGVKNESAASNSNGNLVITAERLSAVMAAMTPIMQQAEMESASRAANGEYLKKKKAFDSCVETQSKSMSTGAMPSMDGMTKSGAMSQKSVDMMQRSQAALQAKRYREYVAVSDSMGAYATLSTLAMFNLETKCGQPVYMSSAMIDIEAAKLSRPRSGEVGENGREKTLVPANQRAGMSTYQFGMIRERAALWALQQTNNAPVGDNKYSVFTAEEMTVLEAQGAQLKKWAPYFKERPSLWATWADLATW